MHLIDVILIGGAIVCFTIAFLIAAKSVKKRKVAQASDIKTWTHMGTGKKSDAAGKEVFNVLHDETQ